MHAGPNPRRRPRALARLARLVLGAACLLLLEAGCATRGVTAGASFVVVRHAQKAATDARDPALSPDGVRSANALAERLRKDDIVAVYATPYRRTGQTGEPTARSHALAVERYDAGEPADALARRLRATHARGTVLVVGHSNTAPQIAAALCGCPVAPLSDADYGDLYRISPGRDGQPVLSHERY